MRALAIAATGMDAQQTNLEVIANNIANINTTGFKRARAEFSDLLYQTERAQGVPNRANQAIVPEGANIGLGVQTAAVRNIHTQGQLTVYYQLGGIKTDKDVLQFMDKCCTVTLELLQTEGFDT